MQTDHNTIDPESMDKASPEFAAYAESLRPANTEPLGLPSVTILDQGWAVCLEVESGEWHVLKYSELLSRQLEDAESFAVNLHPSPMVVVFLIDAVCPMNRKWAYSVAAALEGLVAPLETPWPDGTKATIEIRIRAVLESWQKWLRAENDHYEAKANIEADTQRRELSAKQLAYRNLA